MAAFRNEVVVTADLENDLGWAEFKTVPLAPGLRAAWSLPIRGSDGKVSGSFGTYFRECRGPTTFEREIVGVPAKTAAIAIEKRRTGAALRESDSFLQSVVSAPVDCIKVLDLDGRVKGMNGPGLCAMDVRDFPAIRDADWIFFGKATPSTRPGRRWRSHGAATSAVFQGSVRPSRGFRSGGMSWSRRCGLRRGGRALLVMSRHIVERKRAEEALRWRGER